MNPTIRGTLRTDCSAARHSPDLGWPRDYMEVHEATADRVKPATDEFFAPPSRVPKPLMLHVMNV